MLGGEKQFHDDYDDLEAIEEEPPRKRQKLKHDEPNIPNNFVTEPSLIEPIIVDLKAGEMLYLPCGWFHEVISHSGNDSCHLAFNYWMHPPSTKNFEKPYIDDYWSENVQRLRAKCLQEQAI